MGNRLTFLVFALLVAILECRGSPFLSNEEPVVISRSEWGAADPKKTAETLKKIPTGLVVIHHGGGSGNCTSREDCESVVRSYQRYHMNDNGWDDIGYNFIVGEDGNIYEGRGWDKMGAHAPLVNAKSVGICVIGNFSDRVPKEAALKAIKDLITLGLIEDHIAPDYKLVGHRQVRDTTCPGDAFYKEITQWPHYVPTITL